MITWEEEEKILNLRNTIQKELKLMAMSWTDFDRYIVLETPEGEEEIVQVKEVVYEAKPNARKGANERIIKDFTEQLGWEYITSSKQAWVDGYILHHVYFKY